MCEPCHLELGFLTFTLLAEADILSIEYELCQMYLQVLKQTACRWS